MRDGQATVIDLQGVSVEFRHGSASLPVLRHINLQVKSGQRFGIVGPSGSGKTTLLRTIAGLVPHSEGQVLIDGAPVTRPGHTPNFFGVMFQEPALLNWRTVRGNITLPFELAVFRHLSATDVDQRVARFLGITGLQEFSNFRPAQLSGGMKQRVSLIRCLITRPKVLLLDEPFGALDPMTRTALWQEFDSIARSERLTTLLVTHSIEEAVFLCDVVVVLSDRPARIVASIETSLRQERNVQLLDNEEYLARVKHIRQILYSGNAHLS